MVLQRFLFSSLLAFASLLLVGCSGSGDDSGETAGVSGRGADRDTSSASSSSSDSSIPMLGQGRTEGASSESGSSDPAEMPSPTNPLAGLPLASNPSTLPGEQPAGIPSTPAQQGPGITSRQEGGLEVFQLPGSVPGNGFNAAPLQVPESGTNELLAFIAQVDQRVQGVLSRGAADESTFQEIGQLLETKNTALDRLLAPGIDEQMRLQVLSQKLVTLQQMTQIRYEGAEAKYLELLTSLSRDLNPMVIAGARTRMIEYRAVKLFQEHSEEAYEELREATMVPLRERDVMPQTIQMLQAVIQQMFVADEREHARQLLSELAPILIDHPSEELREVGNAFLDQLLLAQLDFDKVRIDVYAEVPGAIDVLIERTEQLLTSRPLSMFTLETAIDAARTLEISRNFAQSLQVYDRITQVAQASEDPILQTAAARSDRRAKIRLNMIGQPLELEGKIAGGAAFDWSRYRGKVTLIVFWDSTAAPALDEFDTIRELRTQYGDQGFDVVGINLDNSPIEAEQFLAARPVPWVNIVSTDPDRIGFEAPMANRCGVDVLPFHILVDREGKVVDLHCYHYRRDLQIQVGLALGIDPSELPERINGPIQSQTPEDGTQETPGDETPGEAAPEAESNQGDDVPTEEAPANTESADPSSGGEVEPNNEAAESPAADGMSEAPARARSRSWHWISTTTASMQELDEAQAGEEDNPYLAPRDATTAELVDFLLDLQDKPRSLQSRAGLVEAVADAADRILADPQARIAHHRIAALEKLAALHRRAWDDEASQAQLVATLDQVASIDDARVKNEVEFLRLEADALAASQAELDNVARLNLLERLKAFFAGRELEDRHLRLASTSVGIINGLTDSDAKEQAALREAWFKTLGELWGKSEGRQLASYGRRIATPPAASASSLIGLALEIEGTTQSGLLFDMSGYQGKVVVVDFWATWCGPCRKELPNVEATYAELHDRGLEIVGVSLDQDAEALTAFLTDHPLPWETISGDGAKKTAELAAVRAIPTMVLLDRSGKVVAVANRIEELRGQIEALLAE